MYVCMYVWTWLLQVEEGGVGIVPPQFFQLVDLGGRDLSGAKLLLLGRYSNLRYVCMYVCMYDVCMIYAGMYVSGIKPARAERLCLQ